MKLNPACILLLISLIPGRALALDLERIENILKAHSISGASLVVVDRDRVLIDASLGYTDHETREPMTSGHYIRLGSVSKMFLGLTAVKLESQGKLDLTAPLQDILAEVPFNNPWHQSHQVTFAQLLEHTAGLTDMTKKEWDFNEPVSLEAAFLIDPSSRNLKWPPGIHSSYSNSGAGIAAHVIEQITAENFESVVAREIFIPVGLGSATYLHEPRVRQSLITGYDADGTTHIRYWNTLYRAFGGLNIHPRDMARLLQMFLNSGTLDGKQVFTPQQITRMSTPTTTLAARNGLVYGYGLGLYHFTHKGFHLSAMAGMLTAI